MATVEIRSTGVQHTGRAPESITRRVYGRAAELRRTERIADGVWVGMVVRPAKGNQGAYDVLAHVVTTD